MKAFYVVAVSMGLFLSFSAVSTKYTCEIDDGEITFSPSAQMPISWKWRNQTSRSTTEVDIQKTSRGDLYITTIVESYPYLKTLTWFIPHVVAGSRLIELGSKMFETTYEPGKIVQHEHKDIETRKCKIEN